MSLYYEAAELLSNKDNVGGSLKARVFGKKDLKNPSVKIYAVLAESTKWSGVLKEVVENAGILKLERKLTPVLALLLTHDLLLSKKGVAAPANHPLNLAILKHKGRLAAELTRYRIKKRFTDLDELRASVETAAISGSTEEQDKNTRLSKPILSYPRWVRINNLKTSTKAEVGSTFADFTPSTEPPGALRAAVNEQVYRQDANIPDLLALPRHLDIANSLAYKQGRVILQDKASCFPAYLLDPASVPGDIIDACAAPGNKTTHLAALLHTSNTQENGLASGGKKRATRKIFAFERDPGRSKILEKMVHKSGGDTLIDVCANTDFLSSDPNDAQFANVGALLLDPSCSGSGIVGRDDGPQLFLPDAAVSESAAKPNPQSRNGKKRKREQAKQPTQPPAPIEVEEQPLTTPSDDPSSTLQTRLQTLANFQLRLLTHAMTFPAAHRITYSTCSIHATENEAVVFRALASEAARARGWKVLRRREQVEGMKSWGVRGDREGAREALASLNRGERSVGEEVFEDVVEGCLRCEKGTEEGTMGFFVAGFVRDGTKMGGVTVARSSNAAHATEEEAKQEESDNSNGLDEWTGFSDEESRKPAAVQTGERPKAPRNIPNSNAGSQRKSKKR